MDRDTRLMYGHCVAYTLRKQTARHPLMYGHCVAYTLHKQTARHPFDKLSLCGLYAPQTDCETPV